MKILLLFFAFIFCLFIKGQNYYDNSLASTSELKDKVALESDSIAAFNVGIRFWYGLNNERIDRNKSFLWFKKSAELGYAAAQFYLSLCYANGYGCSINHELASIWCKKSAEQGYASAQYIYAMVLFAGDGVQKNISEGIKWMKISAESNVHAQITLAYMYEDGEYVPKNEEMYFLYLNKALGSEKINWLFSREETKMSVCYADILFDLFECYYWGKGVEQDKYKAIKILQQAANLEKDSWKGRSVAAECTLGQFLLDGNCLPKNEKKGFEYIYKSTTTNNPISMRVLARCYLNGTGTTVNKSLYVKWLLKAAEFNDSQSYNDLAYCYMEGIGVLKNKQKAWSYLNKALELSPNNPNYLDSKGEFFSMEGNEVAAKQIWFEINKIDSEFYKDQETKFSKYMRSLNK